MSAASEPREARTADGEPLAVVRKKVLLRLLCRREAERLRMEVGDAEIRAEADRFRRHFALEGSDDFAGWLRANDLDPTAFALAMRDIILVERIEQGLAAEVDALLANQVAIGTARRRLADPG